MSFNINEELYRMTALHSGIGVCERENDSAPEAHRLCFQHNCFVFFTSIFLYNLLSLCLLNSRRFSHSLDSSKDLLINAWVKPVKCYPFVVLGLAVCVCESFLCVVHTNRFVCIVAVCHVHPMNSIAKCDCQCLCEKLYTLNGI